MTTLSHATLEEVDCFKYMGSQVAADGGCNRDVVHRMNNNNNFIETRLQDTIDK